jgi:hypothetical protein
MSVVVPERLGPFHRKHQPDPLAPLDWVEICL